MVLSLPASISSNLLPPSHPPTAYYYRHTTCRRVLTPKKAPTTKKHVMRGVYGSGRGMVGADTGLRRHAGVFLAPKSL
ncbi:hypothetical protein E2C01_101760 [Portunus trituberculatus]|uniref:Uncharacterized protein n=1 Tax=Portunus trituberculatus TaxID=210409 RepID=A0A5B7KGJ2_PORTR|nr:hypothetical protein [Portunus trituberculatus]